MLHPETNKHWYNFCSTAALLVSNGRRDPLVLALLATESFFRPSTHRAFEAVYWLIMNFISPKRSEFISVGISQVQVRHWQVAGIIPRTTSVVSTLMKLYNPLLNYDACRYVISTESRNHEEPEEILRAYTGQATGYHISVFRRFLERAMSLSVEDKPSALTMRPSRRGKPGG